MQKSLFALALAASALAAAPAPAATFPTLTTIYIVAGAEDSTGFATNTATVVYCSNVSGNTASVRLLFLSQGEVTADVIRPLDHAENLTIATQDVFAISEEVVATGTMFGGTIVIESTESGVLCSAFLMDTDFAGSHGVELNLVRTNGHPGAEE
jgi:hypothetical protein